MAEDELSKALEEHGGSDVVIPYHQVADVFPSNVPHPDSFDYKEIDEGRLLSWAQDNSWKVAKVSEQATTRNSPSIRFTKLK